MLAEQAEGPQRLQKVLAQAGLASRRACELLILEGRVTVDGTVVNELGAKVDPKTSKIAVDGQRIQPEAFVYYLVYKPKGYVSTSSDPSGRPLVMDLVPKAKERLFIVGRLDRFSEGLMLLTNDGALAQHLLHPKYGVEKTYRVTVAGEANQSLVQKLTDGIWLAEGKVRARSARIVSRRGNASVLEIVLAEGKNREIRRMLANLDHKVLSLLRVSIGPLQVKGISEGKWRTLDASEVEELRNYRPGTERRTSSRPGADRHSGDARPPARRPERSSSDEPRQRPERSERPERRDDRGGADRPFRDRGGDRPFRANDGGSDRPVRDRGGDRPFRDRGGDRPVRDRGGDRPGFDDRRRPSRADQRPARTPDRVRDDDISNEVEEIVFTDRMDVGRSERKPRPERRDDGGDRNFDRPRPPRRDDESGRPPRRDDSGDGRSFNRADRGGPRPPRRDDGGGRNFDRPRPPRREEGAESRPPRRDDESGRPPRREEGGRSFNRADRGGPRPPRRDDGGGRNFDRPRPPRREEGAESRPPRREEGAESRPPRREEGAESRPPRRDDESGRPPRREEGGRSFNRADRGGSRPPRRDDGGGRNFDRPRPPRRDDSAARPPRAEVTDRIEEFDSGAENEQRPRRPSGPPRSAGPRRSDRPRSGGTGGGGGAGKSEPRRTVVGHGSENRPSSRPRRPGGSVKPRKRR